MITFFTCKIRKIVITVRTYIVLLMVNVRIRKERWFKATVGPCKHEYAYMEAFFVGGNGGDQWGRRIEGWPNTANRLAGRRKVSRQVWFCMRWTGRTACLFRTVPVSLTGAAQLWADGISSCCYMINIHNHPSVMSYVTQGRHGLVL